MTKLSKHRMGTCCSRCCSVIRARSNPSVRFKHLEDGENLIDNSPVMPKSLGSSYENNIVSKKLHHLLVKGKEKSEHQNLTQFTQEEELELQEKSAVEARNEALRIKELRSDSEIINPAQLAYDNTALWLEDDISKWEIVGHEYANDMPEQQPGTSGTSNKVFDSETSTPSSVDLEWENENGLSPLTHIPCDTDTSSDTASCISQLSTPLSNGNAELEWDGHFTSTHISNLDVETDHLNLMREIEQITTDVVEDDHLDR